MPSGHDRHAASAFPSVAALKQRRGGDLLKFGTGEFSKHRLVDEYHFWIVPVATGGGERLLDGVEATHLKLLDTSTFASGIVVHVYGPK